MEVDQKNCQDFKDHFAQTYRRYQIRKKTTASAHGYGTLENHAHETDTQAMTEDALQTLENIAMEEN